MPLSEEERAAAAARPERMAIGGEGGFQVDAKDYKVEVAQVGWEVGGGRLGAGCCSAGSGAGEWTERVGRGCRQAGGRQHSSPPHRPTTSLPPPPRQALVLMPARLRVPLPCPELPELVLGAIAAVQAHDSASKQARVRRAGLRCGAACGTACAAVVGSAPHPCSAAPAPAAVAGRSTNPRARSLALARRT